MRRTLPVVLTTLLTAGVLVAGASPGAIAAATQPPVPGSTFTQANPIRVLDTRTGTGGISGPVGAGRTITLNLTAWVPDTTTAVVLNVTGVSATASTYVTVFPNGLALPNVSSLNLTAGDTRANQVTVALGTNRSVRFYNSGNIHLAADLAGYYGSATTGARFTALPPDRAFDTRPAAMPLGPGVSRSVDLAGRIPASATVVTFNLTATGATAATYVTAWPTGVTRPSVSNLNVVAGDTRPNLVTVAVGANRQINLYNNAGLVDLIVDLTGFYTPEYGAVFLPGYPKRVLDTRNGIGTGGSTSPLGEKGNLPLDFADDVPLTSTGVVLNLTGVAATSATYVSAWTLSAGDPPNASTLNVSPGQTVANAAVTAFGSDRAAQLYNHAGRIHLVADLVGVFAVADPAPCTSDCVYAWGGNRYNRELGTGEAVYSSGVPTRIPALSGVRAVAGGWSQQYALRGDGTVWAWGANELSQLGNGWTASQGGGSTVPVPVRGLTDVTAIAAGWQSGYALRADRTVWAWGSDLFGQLGNGFISDSNVPVQVSSVTDVVAIASHHWTAYALRADGTVWAWGYNHNGELGNGSLYDAEVPAQVPGLTGITAIAAGTDAGYTRRTDGTVWAWGANSMGQLGNGQPCPETGECISRLPVQVAGLTGVTAIAGGGENGYAVRADGTVWAWGSNTRGQLGNGQPCPQNGQCASRVPVRVLWLTGVTHAASFDTGGFALLADGTMCAWGGNTAGQLGNDPAQSNSRVPVPVLGLPGASGISGAAARGYAIVPHP